MKRKILCKIFAAAMAVSLEMLSLAACGSEQPKTMTDTLDRGDSVTTFRQDQGAGDAAAASGQDQETGFTHMNLLTVEDMFTDRDLRGDYDESESIAIALTDSGTVCSSSGVTVQGNTVTVTKEGVYILSGNLNGMIIVDAPDSAKVQLVLKGVQIDNGTNAAVYAREADKLFITLAEGTQNRLSSGGYENLDGNNIDGTVFSKCDLTINGPGNLTVDAGQGNGIVTKDDLVIAGGVITVTAGGHGLEGKDSVRIADGHLNITVGRDGIHSENNDDQEKGFVYAAGGNLVIVSDGDGISAGYCLQLDGGNFSIIAGGGSNNRTVKTDENGDAVSTKGIKASGNFVINGGTYTVDAQDDTLHAGGNLTVNGGILELLTGDDGLHSDETVTVAGGSLNIVNGYEGIEGTDVVIAGGEIRMNVTDDGLNAAGGNDRSGFGGFWGGDRFGGSDSTLTISGGKLYIRAAGDGIDSNGDLVVTGGEVYVSGPENGANGALDYNGTGQITGGTLVAVGASQMAMNFGDTSTQGSILTNVPDCRAGDVIQLKDAQGNILVSYTAESSFNSVVVSCSQLKQGETYTVTAGSSEVKVTLDNLIYGNGMGGFGGPGGRGGMGGGFDGPDGRGGMDGNPGRQGGHGGRGGSRSQNEGREGSAQPDGGVPELPNGEVPAWPDGVVPEMPNGEAPAWPDGGMPAWTDGGAPEMPDGAFDGGRGGLPGDVGEMPGEISGGSGEV